MFIFVIVQNGEQPDFSPILEQINKWWHVHTKGDNTSVKRNKLCEIILINKTIYWGKKKPDQKNIFIYKVKKKKKGKKQYMVTEMSRVTVSEEERVVTKKGPTGKFFGCRHYSISLFGYWFHKCIYFVIHVLFDIFLYLYLASIKIYLK